MYKYSEQKNNLEDKKFIESRKNRQLNESKLYKLVSGYSTS